MGNPLVVVVPKVWFQLVDGFSDEAFKVPFYYVHLPENCNAANLSRAVFEKYSDVLRGKAFVNTLEVYENKTAYESAHRKTMDTIAGHGKTKDNPLIVVVPKVWFRLVNGYSGNIFEGVRADFVSLKVYSDMAAYNNTEHRQELEKFAGHGKREADPIVVVVPNVLFQLWQLSDAALVINENPIVRVLAEYVSGSGVGVGYKHDLVLYRRRELEEEWQAIQICACNTFAQLWIGWGHPEQ
ncbi:unnamed protein product [Phytophthora lilii]|uniref:Unnamed protein product n=1 Tax=Phytophthora lilii TaxID=2077276 RepID=A0A9W6YD76_9STRA|nr:unnamed protein product [Phytophthora lilii]